MPKILIVLGVFLAWIAVAIYYLIFNELNSKSHKEVYLELLSKLKEDPNNQELKEKTIEAGRAYHEKIIVISGSFRGVPTRALPYQLTSASEKEIQESVENAINCGKSKQHMKPE